MIYRVSYKMKTASKTVPVSEIFVKAFSESDAKRRAEENLDTRIYKVLDAVESQDIGNIKGIIKI